MIARLRSLLRQLPAVRGTRVYPAVLVTVLAVLIPGSARSPALGAPAAPAATIISVTPAQGYNERPAPMLIRGGGLASSTKATLGNVPLDDIVLVDSTRLSATVPPDLPGGAYPLTATNPDGTSASSAATTACSTRTGEVVTRCTGGVSSGHRSRARPTAPSCRSPRGRRVTISRR